MVEFLAAFCLSRKVPSEHKVFRLNYCLATIDPQMFYFGPRILGSLASTLIKMFVARW